MALLHSIINWILNLMRRLRALFISSHSAAVSAPTSLSYATNPASYPTGSAITANNPSNSGGTPTSYSVAPALPAGLSLNTSTGAITGTPTAPGTQAAIYVVTATNAGGSTTVNLSIATTPNQAYGDFVVNTNPQNGDTFLINHAGMWPQSAIRGGTFKTSASAVHDDIQIGATIADTIAAWVTFGNANTSRPDMTFSNPSAGIVRVTAGTGYPGTAGNGLLPLDGSSGGRITFTHVDGGSNTTGGTD